MSTTGTGTIITAPSSVSAIGYIAPGSNAFQNPNAPNFIDFLTFLNTTVQIPSAALPLSSPWPTYAFNQAMDLVATAYCMPGVLYSLAVYNCATHILFMITPDQPSQSYFATARSKAAAIPGSGQQGGFALVIPSTGLVASTYDETTGSTFANPDWVKGLTVAQLGFYKTPWGREYLNWAQAAGPNIIGLT